MIYSTVSLNTNEDIFRLCKDGLLRNLFTRRMWLQVKAVTARKSRGKYFPNEQQRGHKFSGGLLICLPNVLCAKKSFLEFLGNVKEKIGTSRILFFFFEF